MLGHATSIEGRPLDLSFTIKESLSYRLDQEVDIQPILCQSRQHSAAQPSLADNRLGRIVSKITNLDTCIFVSQNGTQI
jgi:hypothetical protein